MPIGSSGRVVVELDPEFKRALHDALRRRGSNLKSWLVEQAVALLQEDSNQLPLRFERESSPPWKGQ